MRLRLGTRRSELATTQSGHVAEALRALGHEVELVEIVTEGDVNRAALTQIGGTGVFASALRAALLDDEVDLAVHSLKDLPTAQPAGLVIAAVPERERPHDALVARDGLTLRTLPAGAVIGTGSPRREAQLRVLRPDVEVVPIRGNVGTRAALVADGQLDAVVLAAAGLARLGRSGLVTDDLPEQDMLGAPGQGALAVECRGDRPDVLTALTALDHPPTRLAVTAERALLAALEAGCTAPVGALARLVDGELALEAFVGARDGSAHLRRRRSTPLAGDARVATDLAVALGGELATSLLADGAADLAALQPTPAQLAHPGASTVAAVTDSAIDHTETGE